jgi:hypothetical protein
MPTLPQGVPAWREGRAMAARAFHRIIACRTRCVLFSAAQATATDCLRASATRTPRARWAPMVDASRTAGHPAASARCARTTIASAIRIARTPAPCARVATPPRAAVPTLASGETAPSIRIVARGSTVRRSVAHGALASITHAIRHATLASKTATARMAHGAVLNGCWAIGRASLSRVRRSRLDPCEAPRPG